MIIQENTYTPTVDCFRKYFLTSSNLIKSEQYIEVFHLNIVEWCLGATSKAISMLKTFQNAQSNIWMGIPKW